MSARHLCYLTLMVFLVCALLPQGVLAQNGNADCRNLPNPADDGWTNHQQLKERLQQIESTSSGRVHIEVIGHSHRDREIYAARVGNGDRVLLITSEIHGNEKTGTEALLQMLKTLGSSNSPTAKAIRENITIVAVPKFNPDGAELNRRQNDFPWADVVAAHPQLAGASPAWYYNASIAGFDVNRDFNPDLNYEPRVEDLPGTGDQPGFFLTNESRTLRDLYRELQGEFGEVEAYVDLHHMGPCEQSNDDGQYVTVALDYPPLGPEGNPKYADWPLLDQEKSRRYALAAALGLKEHAGGGNAKPSPFLGGVNRYYHPSNRDLPGQARSAFALNGTGTVLFEVRGQQHSWGQKQKGMLTQVVLSGLFGIAKHMADGTVDELDGDDFYHLPRYW